MKGKWFIVVLLVVLAALAGPFIAQKAGTPEQGRELFTGGPAGVFSGEKSFGEDVKASSGENFRQDPVQSDGSAYGRTVPLQAQDITTGSGEVQKQNSPGEGRRSAPLALKEANPAVALPQNEKESDCTVEVAVVGMNGELLFGPGKVTVTEKNRGGITALGALDATGLPYSTSTRWSNFVDSVAGQSNKGQAGWMYNVNGEVPLTAADQKKLKTADKVIWWYSKRMNEPAPAWEELERQK
ncbi:MAG: DUF4430 domain-containing protein [Desulfotomaculales bacterium]